MEVIAIHLARTIWFFDIQGINPKGQISLLDAVRQLSDRYAFVKVPEAIEQLDFEKGIEFIQGKLAHINIDKLTLFGNGMVVDTRSSTPDCQKVLEDVLEFAKSLGSIVQPTRQMLLSQVIFRSNIKLPNLYPILQEIADTVAVEVSRDYHQPVVYEPTMVSLGADLSKMKLQPSPFTVERRADTPFDANVYFSSAPVGTELHLLLLQRLESALEA